jgi:hypothetical protein
MSELEILAEEEATPLAFSNILAPFPGWQTFELGPLLIIESCPLVSIYSCDSSVIEAMLSLNLIRPCVDSERTLCHPNGDVYLQWAYEKTNFTDNTWNQLDQIYSTYHQGNFYQLNPAEQKLSPSLQDKALLMLSSVHKALLEQTLFAEQMVFDDSEAIIILFPEEDTPLFIRANPIFNVVELACPINFEVTSNILTPYQAHTLMQINDAKRLPVNSRMGLDVGLNLLMLRMWINTTTDAEQLIKEILHLLAGTNHCETELGMVSPNTLEHLVEETR